MVAAVAEPSGGELTQFLLRWLASRKEQRKGILDELLERHVDARAGEHHHRSRNISEGTGEILFREEALLVCQVESRAGQGRQSVARFHRRDEEFDRRSHSWMKRCRIWDARPHVMEDQWLRAAH